MNEKTGLKLVNVIMYIYLAKKWDQVRHNEKVLLQTYLKKYIAMNRFTKMFKKTPAVIGMIHVKPLPGKFLRVMWWDEVFKSGLSKFLKVCLPQNLLSPFLNICLIWWDGQCTILRSLG